MSSVALSVDIHFQDTYFVVAHFHYVMVGSMLFAFIGGMNYWFPKMFGKMYNERVAMFAAIGLAPYRYTLDFLRTSRVGQPERVYVMRSAVAWLTGRDAPAPPVLLHVEEGLVLARQRPAVEREGGGLERDQRRPGPRRGHSRT